jgi:hypothetical protein
VVGSTIKTYSEGKIYTRHVASVTVGPVMLMKRGVKARWVAKLVVVEHEMS